MKLNITDRGILQIDDARITFRNFSGIGTEYNREGDRNFSLVIPDMEMAEILEKEGWNIKIKPPRTEDEEPFITLPVKVSFNEMGPNIFLISGGKAIKLDEHTVHRLDRISIANVSLDIRPYDWTVNGKNGRKAYLSSMEVEQNIDRFSMKYDAADFNDEAPFEE